MNIFEDMNYIFLMCKNNKFRFASLITIVVFCFVSLIYLKSKSSTEIQGDGHEYVLQTSSIQNHFSFGITEDDLKLAKTEFSKNQVTLNKVYNSLPKVKNITYCYHYGAYSALVVPVKLLLLKFSKYPIRAFHLTNLLLWTIALLTIFIFLKADDEQKFYLLLLTSVNPAFFYLNWVHTEIYCFSFIVVGLVFFYNKNYYRAILFTSIASMQNLAILPIVAIVGLDFIYNLFVENRSSEKKCIGFFLCYWKKFVIAFFMCVPGFLPIIVNYILFSTYSLVASHVMEKTYLVGKSLAYLFDLNLGILPFEPIVLFIFIFMIFIGLKKNFWPSIINVLGVGGILFIISHEVQINCGMHCIARYNLYIIPLMIFFVVMNWNHTFEKRKNTLFYRISVSLASILCFVTVSFCFTKRGEYNYLQFASWTKKILNTIPSLYNPPRGIFYSRAIHYELYHADYPVFYYDEINGFPRKVLLNADSEKSWYENFVFCDSAGKKIDNSKLIKIYIDRKKYYYLNLPLNITLKYNLNNKLVCKKNDSRITPYSYFYQGLSVLEDWGSWTDGHSVKGRFCIDSDEKKSPLTASFNLATVFNGKQHVIAKVNDETVFDGVVTAGNNLEFPFMLPDDGLVSIVLELPDACSPKSLGQSEDSRILALAIQSFEISDKSMIKKID